MILLLLITKVEDEAQTIILLNSLPEKYKEVKSSIMYGRDELSLDMVILNLRLKYLDIKTIERSTIYDCLYVRDRSERKEKGSIGKAKVKSQSWTKKVVRSYYYKKEGYFRHEFPMLKGKS